MATCPVRKAVKQEGSNPISGSGIETPESYTASAYSTTEWPVRAARPPPGASQPEVDSVGSVRSSWEWVWPWQMAAAGPVEPPGGAGASSPSLDARGVYLRGAAVPNSPARSISEWQKALREGARKTEEATPASPNVQRIFKSSDNWSEEDDDGSKGGKMQRKPSRRAQSARHFLDDEQASGYISEDEEPEADKENKKDKVSDTESFEEEEKPICSYEMMRKIDCVVERSRLARRMNVPLDCPLPEWDQEPLGPLPLPEDFVPRPAPALTLPIAALRQRRRCSQLAAQRLQSIRHEIDSKLAEIEEKISKETLPPERLTYSYVVHKFKSVAGDVESSDEEQRAAGAAGAAEDPPGRATMWAGGAALPVALRCAQRRPFTAPHALMRRRLADAAVTGIHEEEQPASMPATGDEASTASASPEARSPVHSRRRRVRKASAGRRRSQEPPGSSSSSSVSSTPSSHNSSARGRWRVQHSPLRILPSSVRKRPSILRVSSASASPSTPNP